MITYNLDIVPIPVLKDNYVWLIIESKESLAIVVDPGTSVEVSDYLKRNKLKLAAIFLTHHHGDHVNGAQVLSDEFNAPIYGPEKDNINYLDFSLTEGDRISLPFFPTFNFLDIPGHTLGHGAYYGSNLLFCGDTLFSAGCGRVFEGTNGQMYASLLKLAALPDETFIYCGHEYTLKNLTFANVVEPRNQFILRKIEEITEKRNKNFTSLPSTLKDEKMINPFLRCSSKDVINSVQNYSKVKLTDPVKVFTQLRQWKDAF